MRTWTNGPWVALHIFCVVVVVTSRRPRSTTTSTSSSSSSSTTSSSTSSSAAPPRAATNATRHDPRPLKSSVRTRPKSMEREKVFQTARGTNYTWPYREQVAQIDGDIMLGGLMMVHERDEDMICGKIMPQGGLQATEMMLYTIQKINAMDLIPGIRLGARIKDDCDRDIYGLEQSVDFIRGSVSQIAGTTEECEDGEQPEMIAGVVAAPSSVTSIQVANLLKLFKIPQVSFFSTSPDLSNDERYPYFMRTIPSDTNQAEAMVELVKLFNWTYVSVVYEESSYGQKGYAEVDELLKKEGICLAVTDKLIKDSGVATAVSYDKIVARLKKKSHARGVIVFGSDQEVGELMRATDRANMSGFFTWIGSDGWGGRVLVSNGNERQVEGAVTVQPYAEPVIGFEEYFLNRTAYDNNTLNPWFVEYWEDYFHCRVPGTLETPFNQNYSRVCDGSERQTLDNGYVAEAQLQFVSDAVMVFAEALKDMHQHVCGIGSRGPCEDFDPYDGEALREYVLNANFTGLSGETFHFLPNGDGPPRYRILNFRQNVRNQYEWVTVGLYQNRRLTMNMSELKFTYDEPVHPESVCSKQCKFNEAQMFVEGDDCCWTCSPCTKFAYLPTPYTCQQCPLGSKPSADLTSCVPIPEEYLSYDSWIAIAAMSVAGIGIIVTLYVIQVFIKFRDTPVVKASGRELSFVLLAGVLVCYSMTFIIIASPTNIICAAQKFGIGFCFSICYSALLTKTNRIARIFRAGKRTARRPKFISPQSQLVICFGLVGVQLLIGTAWLLLEPPKAGHYYPTREDNQLVCISSVGPSYMIGFAYPIVLIVVCTVYAILTRKIPEAFNESKYIGFTMYTTCIIWLAFVPIYFSTANNIEIRLATMCFSISLSATVSLVCLFTPKLHIILLHPERNVRQSMMATKSNATTSTAKQNSLYRMDSGTQSDGEMELHQRLKPSGSISSGFSRSTTATQTHSGGTSISTQTLDSVGQDFDDMDVQL